MPKNLIQRERPSHRLLPSVIRDDSLWWDPGQTCNPITPVRLTPLLYAWEVQPKVNASRMVSVQCQPSLSTLASQYTCEKLSFKSQSLRMSVIQCILIKFILVGKPILIVGRTIPWAGIRYCRKWRRQAEGEHSLLSASCLWMCSARLLRALAAATFPPCWTIPDCEPK